jgi:hypothetical protein
MITGMLFQNCPERVKKLSVEFNAVLVDFPAVFDKAIKTAPVEYWIWDGIQSNRSCS